ncbi:phage tail assembly chaperone [Glacieibacterium sp.]
MAQRLGWGPDTFWAATPADLRLALGVEPVGEAADGAALGRLMETFPDG